MPRASSYTGSSAFVLADPKTVIAGPTLAMASKPSTNSERIRRVRHGSVWRNSALGRVSRNFSSSVLVASPSIISAALGVTTIRPARRCPGVISSMWLGCHRGGADAHSLDHRRRPDRHRRRMDGPGARVAPRDRLHGWRY